MTPYRLLIVEDNEQDLKNCIDSIDRYQHQRKRQFDIHSALNVEEALGMIDGSFDGAIIDLRLGQDGNEGNSVVEGIVDAKLRIPVAILTGTPDAASCDLSYIGVFKKGETGYDDILDRFWQIHMTGLSRIMGGRGLIEDALESVFRKHLLPQIGAWIEHAETDPDKAQAGLLRHTVNHLIQFLDDDSVPCYTEEFYLSPPCRDDLHTGSIVTKDNSQFVVLTPACDLVIRKSRTFKTDRILLVEIDDLKTTAAVITGIDGNAKKKKAELDALARNTYCGYFHFLPKSAVFDGGIMNFRKLVTLSPAELESITTPKIQISAWFIKDIVARFAAYYSRQGQPDLDSAQLVKQIWSSLQ